MSTSSEKDPKSDESTENDSDGPPPPVLSFIKANPISQFTVPGGVVNTQPGPDAPPESDDNDNPSPPETSAQSSSSSNQPPKYQKTKKPLYMSSTMISSQDFQISVGKRIKPKGTSFQKSDAENALDDLPEHNIVITTPQTQDTPSGVDIPAQWKIKGSKKPTGSRYSNPPQISMIQDAERNKEAVPNCVRWLFLREYDLNSTDSYSNAPAAFPASSSDDTTPSPNLSDSKDSYQHDPDSESPLKPDQSKFDPVLAAKLASREKLLQQMQEHTENWDRADAPASRLRTHPFDPLDFVLDIRHWVTDWHSQVASAELFQHWLTLRTVKGKYFKKHLPKPFKGVSIGTPKPNQWFLKYPHQEGAIKDGPLFKSKVLEDKWDLYMFNNFLYFCRSWTGSLAFVAKLAFIEHSVYVTAIWASPDFIPKGEEEESDADISFIHSISSDDDDDDDDVSVEQESPESTTESENTENPALKINLTEIQVEKDFSQVLMAVIPKRYRYAIQIVDFLIKSHLFGRMLPHPISPSLKIPPNVKGDSSSVLDHVSQTEFIKAQNLPYTDIQLKEIATHGFSLFGRWAGFATFEDSSNVTLWSDPEALKNSPRVWNTKTSQR